jgi:hypothetical protein
MRLLHKASRQGNPFFLPVSEEVLRLIWLLSDFFFHLVP